MQIKKNLSDNTILSELGMRIARYRLNRNLTQNTLSKEAGVSERTVQRAERGKTIQTTNLIRILRALGLVQNLEALIPQPTVSPIEQLKNKGKRRQRASSVTSVTSVTEKKEEKPGWSWGDNE